LLLLFSLMVFHVCACDHDSDANDENINKEPKISVMFHLLVLLILCRHSMLGLVTLKALPMARKLISGLLLLFFINQSHSNFDLHLMLWLLILMAMPTQQILGKWIACLLWSFHWSISLILWSILKLSCNLVGDGNRKLLISKWIFCLLLSISMFLSINQLNFGPSCDLNGQMY